MRGQGVVSGVAGVVINNNGQDSTRLCHYGSSGSSYNNSGAVTDIISDCNRRGSSISRRSGNNSTISRSSNIYTMGLL